MAGKNISARTRLGKIKEIESSSSKPKKVSNDLNNSYVTIVSEDVPERSTETMDAIIVDLRNKLSDAQYDLSEKVEQVNDLTGEIQKLQRKIETQHVMIANLEDTIKLVSQQKSMVSDTSTQTTEPCEATVADGDRSDGPGMIREAVARPEAVAIQRRERDFEPDADPPMRRPKILLLGDDQGRSMASKMSQVFKNAYEVQSIFKPNACVIDVMSDAASLTRSFGVDDFVVLLAGTNNIIKNQQLNHSSLSTVLNNMSHTKIIVLTVPYQCYDMTINDRIFRFNTNLYNYCMSRESKAPGNLFYYDVNYYLEQSKPSHINFNLSIRKKERLSVYIREIVQNITSLKLKRTLKTSNSLVNNNLIYINTNQDFPLCHKKDLIM